MVHGLLAAAAPLMLAALGGLLSDLVGSLGIFLEGFMVLGSFFSWTFALSLSSPWLGIALSAAGAAILGWGLARFVRATGANPFIVGLALNLAAGGVTDVLSTAWFGTKGVLRDPRVFSLPPVDFPILDGLPILGTLLSGELPFVYLAWVMAAVAAVVVGHSRVGLRLRASGAAPEATTERGIDPRRYREGAWAAAAALAALAGAALTFRVGAYAPGGTAGRGWIALAAVYLGFRKVWGVVAAALLFAAAERLGSAAQGAAVLPATVLLGLPSALALILYSLSRAMRKIRERSVPPS